MLFPKRRKSEKAQRRAVPDGLWLKCNGCGEVIFHQEFRENLDVCPRCGYHARISAKRRLETLVDEGSFEERHAGLQSTDPLNFVVGTESYAQRLRRAQEATGLTEALITGFATIEGASCALGIMDTAFMMASMGSVVGEKFCRLVADAIEQRLPLVVVAASGGARMQEGIIALMQMAKTADACRQLREAGLPYIVVMTDPTTGGVLASFAALADIILAEPKAHIGFAGPRLIEGALKVKLPPSFQTAEYQFENGFIDRIVPRKDLRPLLGKLLRYLAPTDAFPRVDRRATALRPPAADGEINNGSGPVNAGDSFSPVPLQTP